jgi:hypothetical protein
MTSRSVPERLARQVRTRAHDCCEYCRLPQEYQEATFHIDHVNPVADGGLTSLENLALACVSCSLRKGSRTRALDSLTETVVEIFNPRKDRWDVHFRFSDGVRIDGRTPKGRATIALLSLNRPALVQIRELLIDLGIDLQRKKRS